MAQHNYQPPATPPTPIRRHVPVTDAECNSTNPAAFNPRALVLCETGRLLENHVLEKLVPVFVLCRKDLGALIVFEHEGITNHKLVLIKERLKSIEYPALLFCGERFNLDDLNRAEDLLKDRLEKLIEPAIVGIRLEEGVYSIVFGYVWDCGQHCIAIAAMQ